MFRFASPDAFFLLVALPVIWLLRKKQAAAPSVGISTSSGLGGFGRSLMVRASTLMPAVKTLAFIAMVLAMARPQWGVRQGEILTEGVNIVLAVDLSESMSALDFKLKGEMVNRLEAVKDVIRRFIEKRQGDRIGMVVFGSEAYTQMPLTRDYNAIATVLDRLAIGSAGKQTAIGNAIGISIKRLSDITSKSNIVILLTDGQSNTGAISPETATQIAVDKKVKIYTIGVGTRGKAPFLIHHPIFGDQYVYQPVDIDEGALQKIADSTGGTYFRATDTEGLSKIYDTIDRMEKTQVKVKTFADYKELYPPLLAAAFGLLVLWIVLTHTRFLRVP
jgi:Ca-activated chloride channel homolog